MTAYYNENNPYAAQWLRNLIKAGHIADGEVDERSIGEVTANDVVGFTQAHFFAGIGVWSHALRRADWPDDRPVWTGSCPCQPFSSAGKQAGFADPRHLWPTWFALIKACRPPNIFGEQAASKDGLAWLDLVLSDLEDADYTAGAVDLCAAGVGAPHIRQRLWIVADAANERRPGLDPLLRPEDCGRPTETALPEASGDGQTCIVADSSGARLGVTKESRDGCRNEARHIREDRTDAGLFELERNGLVDRRLAYADVTRSQGRTGGSRSGDQQLVGSDRMASFWDAADWIICRDNKARPIEPGTLPLVDGSAKRSVGRLRAYGNAIVAPVASEIIGAYMALER